MESGLNLLAWALGTLALGVMIGVLTESVTEFYREAEPLRWLRWLVESVPPLRKWSECGFCFSAWVAVGLAVGAFFIFPKLSLSVVCAAPIGWRVSHWWHDKLRLLELTKDSIKAD